MKLGGGLSILLAALVLARQSPAYELAAVLAVAGVAMSLLGRAKEPKVLNLTRGALPETPNIATITLIIIMGGIFATWLLQ